MTNQHGYTKDIAIQFFHRFHISQIHFREIRHFRNGDGTSSSCLIAFGIHSYHGQRIILHLIGEHNLFCKVQCRLSVGLYLAIIKAIDTRNIYDQII